MLLSRQHFLSDVRIAFFSLLLGSWRGQQTQTSSEFREEVYLPFLAVLSQSSGGAAKAMSKYLSDLVKAKSVLGLYDDTVATFLRIGATNTMVNHPTTSLTDAIRRGGWDFSGICNVWEYILQLSESLAIAGRALAGYSNSRNRCFPARLSCLTDVDENALRNLVNDLFFHDGITFEKDMEDFVNCLFAVLPMSLEDMLSTYTARHMVIQILHDKAAKFNITLTKMKQWGIIIKNDWMLRNCTQLQSNIDVSAVLQKEILSQRNEIQEVKRKLDDMKHIFDGMITILQTMQLAPSPSNSPKGSRSSTPSPKRPRKRGRDDLGHLELMGEKVDMMIAANSTNALTAASFFSSDNRTAVPISTSGKSITLSTAFVNSICGGARFFNQDTASRSALCLDYMRKLMSDEERNFLKLKKPSETSHEYKQWSDSVKALAANLKMRAYKDLLRLEGKDPDAKSKKQPTIEGFAKRLKKLSRESWDRCSNSSSSVRIMSNFVINSK